jgi:DNA invertase Pin-like site-specific DNA recombinase
VISKPDHKAGLTKNDRLSRGTDSIIPFRRLMSAAVAVIKEKGDLYLDQQSIDTTTPAGKLMFQVTGAFAEFERSMIRQRVHAGLKRVTVEERTAAGWRWHQHHGAQGQRRHRHCAAHQAGNERPFRRRGRVRPRAHK